MANVVLPDNWTEDSGVDGVFVPIGYNTKTTPAAVCFLFMGKFDKSMAVETFAISSSLSFVRANKGRVFKQVDWNIVRDGYRVIIHKIEGFDFGFYKAYISGPYDIFASINFTMKSEGEGSDEYIDAFKVCLERLTLSDIESLKE
jgi:hypothetical protein